jgi:hypothetical protein
MILDGAERHRPRSLAQCVIGYPLCGLGFRLIARNESCWQFLLGMGLLGAGGLALR